MKYYDLKNSMLFFENGNFHYSFDNNTIKKNLISKKWGDWPIVADHKQFRSITINLNILDKKKIKGFPNFIVELSNLVSLGMPIDFLGKMTSLPVNLKTLRLFKPVFEDNVKFEWPKSLKPDRLTYIEFPELIYPIKMDFTKTLNLEWIDFDLQAEKNNSIILELAKVKKIKHLIFKHPKNFDIISPFLNNGIISLELFACTGKTFSLDSLVKFKKLKYFYLNNIVNPFDCNIIAELPEIMEINFKNIKKLHNIEALLKCKKLKSINIMNCKNAFDNVDKKLFYDNNYEDLNIEFA